MLALAPGVNGPMFLTGWVVALDVVSGVAYVLAVQGNASTSSTTSETIAWVGRIDPVPRPNVVR